MKMYVSLLFHPFFRLTLQKYEMLDIYTYNKKEVCKETLLNFHMDIFLSVYTVFNKHIQS